MARPVPSRTSDGGVPPSSAGAHGSGDGSRLTVEGAEPPLRRRVPALPDHLQRDPALSPPRHTAAPSPAGPCRAPATPALPYGPSSTNGRAACYSTSSGSNIWTQASSSSSRGGAHGRHAGLDLNSRGDVDRISALDNDLCVRILRLAHLNVRELVRTSVLSKRWCGLWKRVPVLDFFGWPQLNSADDVLEYIGVVNDVLAQRACAISEAHIDEVKIPLLLEVLSLRRQGQQLHKAAMIAAGVWISYAMHHQVKGFQFDLCMLPFTIELPIMDLDELLPSSPKLECMHLAIRRAEVRLPRTAVFTSLKDLTLEWVNLAAGSGHLLSRLLSSVSCPSLQKLCMMCVRFPRTEELVLDAGKLLELSMNVVYDMVLLELRTPKLLCLKIKGVDLELLTVSAPGLKELTYTWNCVGLVHGPLPCVLRLKIDLDTHAEEGADYADDANSGSICLLKKCSSSVRCLLVCLDIPMRESRHVDLIKDKIPQLHNVISLLVSTNDTCQRHSFGDGVASLLTRVKNLEYLSLRRRLYDPEHMHFKSDEYYSKGDADSTFTCNHPDHWESSNISFANLRKAVFRGMTGTGCELRFLQLVLANATNLRSVTVSFNLCFFEEDNRMHYFLHALLGGGTWTTSEDEDKDKDEDEDEDEDKDKCRTKLYKWAPSLRERGQRGGLGDLEPARGQAEGGGCHLQRGSNLERGPRAPRRAE